MSPDLIKKLNKLLTKQEKSRALGLFFMILIGSFAELLGVSVLLPIMDLAMNDTPETSMIFRLLSNAFGTTDKERILLLLIVGTVALYILKSVYLSGMYSRLYHFAADTKRRLATSLMESYLRKPYPFFLYRASSDLIRSVNSDTAQLYEVLVNILLILSNAVTSGLLIIYLAVTNFAMTMTIALLLGLCAAVILFVVQKRTRRYGKVNQEMQGYLIRYLQQAIEGIKEIKILRSEEFYINRYSEAYREQTEVERKSRLVNLIPKYIIEAVCISGILLYLGANVLWNPHYRDILLQLGVFAVSAFKLLPAVNAVYAYMNTIMYHKASIDLVYRDMEEAGTEERLQEEERKKLPFASELSLDRVSFRYEGTDTDILKDVSFTVKKGESIGFIGASGGGKTTTADLILGLLSPVEGTVTVDGRNIAEDLTGWQSNIGYIPQSIFLTDDSVRRNVALGIPDEKIDEERVLDALAKAKLTEFVKALPGGLDTEVGERGMRISGGQRQRIGIARALYRDPEVLVFDEATSALDNETEREVMEAVEGLQGEKTILMIAHRLTTIEHCDHVFRIEEGKVLQIR